MLEGVIAAQDLSDELDPQAEIAASLIGLPHDQVRAALLSVAPPGKNVIKSLAFVGPASAPSWSSAASHAAIECDNLASLCCRAGSERSIVPARTKTLE